MSAGRTLTVYLAADTSGFRRQMGQAGEAVDGPGGFRGRVSGLAGSLTNVLGPAMVGAGIAAAALAFKFGVEGVQAAIAEQVELEKLHTALTNLGFAEATAAVDAFIEAQARATTFSDSDLRPAFQKLAEATGSVDQAQRLLKIAMDAAIGSGKSLDTVVQNLAKAANGNTTALEKMFPWLKQVDGATGNLDVTTAALAERFSGQAATAAATWSGKLGNAKEAFDELKEAFGQGFLTGLGNAEDKTTDLTEVLYDLQEPIAQLGTTIGEWLSTLAQFASNVSAMKEALDGFRTTIDDTPWAKVFDGFGGVLTALANGPVLFLISRINEAIAAFKALNTVAATSVTATPAGPVPWSNNPNGTGQPGSENAPRSLTPTVVYTNVLTQLLAKGDAREGKLAHGGVLR